jgi:hypothetical protein
MIIKPTLDNQRRLSMKRRSIFLSLLSILFIVLIANPASAELRFDPYVGVGVGAAMQNGCDDGGNDNGCEIIVEDGNTDVITDHDPGVKAFLGLRLHDNFAIEAGYYSLGEGLDDDELPDMFDIWGAAASALFILPIDEGSHIFARAGAFYGEITETEGQDHSIVKEENGISPIFGIGGQFQASPNFSIRVETEYIPNAGDGTDFNDDDNNNNTGDVDVLLATINLIWHPSAPSAENPFLRTGTQWSSATGFYIGGGVAGVSFSGGEVEWFPHFAEGNSGFPG